MSKIIYGVVNHDGGCAYEKNGTYSERSSTRQGARRAAGNACTRRHRHGEPRLSHRHNEHCEKRSRYRIAHVTSIPLPLIACLSLSLLRDTWAFGYACRHYSTTPAAGGETPRRSTQLKNYDWREVGLISTKRLSDRGPAHAAMSGKPRLAQLRGVGQASG
jgi:hypothetical protein